MQTIQMVFNLTDVSNRYSSCVVVVHIFLCLKPRFLSSFPTDELFCTMFCDGGGQGSESYGDGRELVYSGIEVTSFRAEQAMEKL
jgi:hypothetical protein